MGLNQEVDLGEFVRSNSTSNANGTLCLICNAWIQFKKNVKRHFREIHLEADVQFLCPKCNSTHKNRSTFKGHIFKAHPEWKGLDINIFMRKSEPSDH